MTRITARPLQTTTQATPPASGFSLSTDDLAILDTVRAALVAKRTLLAYQPIMQARDTARVALHEGLIRVRDAAGNLLPAGRFMPVVETTALGRDIDCAALEHGMRALHAVPGLRLAVNVSARSVDHAGWRDTLDRWLALDPTVGERLVLEITESSAMRAPDEICAFMRDRQRDGICFALDDFGAGHTSLRHLRAFSFDFLKIDGQFIRGIATDRDNMGIVQAIVAMARHFEMVTVAEFVETEDDAAVLAEMGIDCLQGHLFAAADTRPPWAGAGDPDVLA
ncbi:EAL domain-containing protein [Sulfitobacter sp. D35]|uniref:EAL domain-containing protein n=1 Tax=Sulfitobacter sp. D35 TaxID=3083252 RepID=UPI00296FEEE3|nr:EAL domain-containing protein [Sulfitobacter sp. D35]MDW4499802.1 EAL domain-containing protein [Sulfitobacter sp. D35]